MFWPIADRTKGFQSLNAAVATGAGKALACAGATKFGLQCIPVGSPATCIVTLQVSNDGGVTWSTAVIATWDTTIQGAGDIVFAVDKPCSHVRANCTTLTVGAGKNVSAYISASD